MQANSKHLWKLTAASAAILAIATALSGYVHCLILLPACVIALWLACWFLLQGPLSRGVAVQQSILDELRDAKEYLEGIVENSPDLIITVTLDGLIETFNRGAEQALGYRREEVIGTPIESLYVDPRERRAAAACLEATGYLKNYESRFRARDGRIVNTLLTLSHLLDSEGTPIGTIGISKDITERKNLQDALRNAREHLEGAIEHSADIIITVDTEKRIQTFNRGGEEALGYTREEMIGKPIESLYLDPGERHAAVALLEETGHLKNYETRLVAKDGRVVNILLTLSLLHDSDGSPVGTIGISKDITHRKKLQDQLRDAKEYLEGIVENSSDIIITVTPEGFIETFNRGAEQALGYVRDEVIGRRIETLFADPRDRDLAIEQLKSTDNVENFETCLLTKSGEERIVLVTLSRLRDRDGNPIGTFGISKDITRRRKLQQELLQSQKYAAIGQAVTRIQHAIKNMLNSLKGGAYLVRVGMGKDNRKRIAEGWLMVEEGIERISSLSYNMLNFAKEWKPQLKESDLSELVIKVCEQNRQAAAEQGVVLRHQVTDGLPTVLCDPKLIHMATTDIVVNAIDACNWKHYGSGETPEVLLEASLGECRDCFVIEVRDNGCGMTEEVRQNIFTPFFSTKESQGTGLGLAVTDKIIRVHEGEISVESEPERGTKFRIRIPLDGPGDKRGGDDGQASTGC